MLVQTVSVQDNVDAIWTEWAGDCLLRADIVCARSHLSVASGELGSLDGVLTDCDHNRFAGAPAEIRKNKANFLYILPSSYFDSSSKWGHYNLLFRTSARTEVHLFLM